MCDDITNAVVKKESIIDPRFYHTIKEGKNGLGPAPIKTKKGWLHLAHGVRNTAAGMRYVLYLFLCDLKDPSKQIAAPGGHFMGPEGDERVGDVSNVVFANGWVARQNGDVFIYYGSSDTRTHVATTTVEKLLDYVTNTPPDARRSKLVRGPALRTHRQKPQMKVRFLAGMFLLAALTTPAADQAGIFNVLEYGALGDGTNNDTAAIQRAVDACVAGGGGQVLLPGGKKFLAGAIMLGSNVDFHLARGAVLKGSPRWQDYGEAGALLFAKDATNLTISGDGMLDGNDHAVWQQLANELAGGDVNKPGWWPQAFCGVWWPFEPERDEQYACRRPADADYFDWLPACPHARHDDPQRAKLDDSSGRVRRYGH